MIYELRQRKIEASEEGGIALTDSAAVELMLSLFILADHPGHSIAWFHLKNSLLGHDLKSCEDAESLSKKLRRDLFAQGYGKFSAGWAKRIAPSCGPRDLSRLQQFVEMAYDFEPRSSSRTDEFVAWVGKQRAPDPSFANVRVMTIHGAKGLEFDAVVLPELDVTLTSRPPTLVVGRDPETLEANFVCRYAAEELQKLLTPKQRQAFERERQSSVEESLSLLYVALTRAIHALYLFIPGARRRKRKDTWSALLEKTLAPPGPATQTGPLFEIGDPNWSRGLSVAATGPESAPLPLAHDPIRFHSDPQKHRRGLERMAPSRREGNGQQSLKRLFDPSEGTGMSAGVLYHLWFSRIEWLGHDLPAPDELRRQAEKGRADLPDQVWKNLDFHIRVFRSFLEKPEVAGVLRRSIYDGSERPGFPAGLSSFWNRSVRLEKVDRELKFLVPEGAQFWDGAFDRIVWFSQGDKTVAADLIDFKTDNIDAGNKAALEERALHYRPQMEIYRRAAARLGGISEERVSVRLVFAKAGWVKEV
jgi:ATP-dependent helicase/nuclease subunit A